MHGSRRPTGRMKGCRAVYWGIRRNIQGDAARRVSTKGNHHIIRCRKRIGNRLAVETRRAASPGTNTMHKGKKPTGRMKECRAVHQEIRGKHAVRRGTSRLYRSKLMGFFRHFLQSLRAEPIFLLRDFPLA